MLFRLRYHDHLFIQYITVIQYIISDICLHCIIEMFTTFNRPFLRLNQHNQSQIQNASESLLYRSPSCDKNLSLPLTIIFEMGKYICRLILLI